jgi:hypothetical protein
MATSSTTSIHPIGCERLLHVTDELTAPAAPTASPPAHVDSSESRTPPDPAPAAPPGWVPVERRWLGLDRRTVVPALVVLAFALVCHLGLPLLNAALPYDEETAAGDVMVMKSDVSFIPATGWSIEDGIIAGDEPVSGSLPRTTHLTRGEVSYEVTVGTFDGTAPELLGQIKDTTDALHDSAGFHVVGDPVDIATTAGVQGVLSQYTGTRSDGALAAFVQDGVGVQVVSTGPTNTDREVTEEVARMIVSLRFDPDPAAAQTEGEDAA